MNGDIAFAKFVHKFAAPEQVHSAQTELHYFLGMAITNWLVWQLGVTTAIIFGAYIPSDWGIGFATIK